MQTIKLEDAKMNIGKCVRKTSGVNNTLEPKPFKSGLKFNTIKDVINHPVLNIPAYTFSEDDTYVECRRCVVVDRIIIDNGDVFIGTREMFANCFFTNADDENIINWCKENNWKLSINGIIK